VVLAGALEVVEDVGVLDETGVDEDALEGALEDALEALVEVGVDEVFEEELDEAATDDALEALDVVEVAGWVELADDEDEAD